MDIAETARFYNELLEIEKFAADPSNNGLQVCGSSSKICRKIAFAVDASLASIEKAVECNADMLVVHHGLSWGGEPRRWSGSVGRRFAAMFKNDLALYAMHLPLDAHRLYGNNSKLAGMMQLSDWEDFFPYHGMNIGFIGNAPQGITLEKLSAMAAGGKEKRIFAPQHIDPATAVVRRAAVVSGGGGLDGLECAIAAGADVLVTGEFDHTMYHVVQENNIAVVALGHYNSEVHGVQNLQQVAEQQLGMQTVFLDIPTGL